MKGLSIDIYFLIFACVFLFFSLIFFLIVFFNHYRNKQHRNTKEKEELKVAFRNTLLQSQLEIQEQTFNDISQELHDNIGQILSLAKVQISIMNESDNISKENLMEVKHNISYAIDDLRSIAKSLSSERIRSTDIHAAVAGEIERINRSKVVCIKLVIAGDAPGINDQKKLILFRIIQESMQNIIKHARATDVEIFFHYMQEHLQVIIKDNGIGFDPRAAEQMNGGLGLGNIRTRALLTGGSSHFESILNQGTTLTLKIPYD